VQINSHRYLSLKYFIPRTHLSLIPCTLLTTGPVVNVGDFEELCSVTLKLTYLISYEGLSQTYRYLTIIYNSLTLEKKIYLKGVVTW